MKLPKIIVQDFDPNDPKLEKIKQKNLAKAKDFFTIHPYANQVYVAMETKLPYSFVKTNWNEITGGIK